MRKILQFIFLISVFFSTSQEHFSDGTKLSAPKGFVKSGSNGWKNSMNFNEYINIYFVDGDKSSNLNKSSCEDLNALKTQFIDYKFIQIEGASYELCVKKFSSGNRIAISHLSFYSMGGTFAITATANQNDYKRCEELISFMVKQIVKPSSNQNKIVFTDGKSVNLSILNNQLIDVVGASNFPVSKSTIKQFLICFFGKIGSTNSYKTYQKDLKKAENYSNDKEERTYFLFSLNYINSALWSCMNENPEFLEEYSKVDKIIPQSDLKIKAFAEVHLADIKKEMGKVKFIEMSKVIDWERYSECFARKMWENFTPKEMYNMSPENENKLGEMQENCMEVNLK